MPMSPKGHITLVVPPIEPEIISMKMPTREWRGRSGVSRQLLEQLTVGTDDCAFFPLAKGKTIGQLRSKIGSAKSAAQKNIAGSQFEMRTTKCGAVEGIGVWRTA